MSRPLSFRRVSIGVALLAGLLFAGWFAVDGCLEKRNLVPLRSVLWTCDLEYKHVYGPFSEPSQRLETVLKNMDRKHDSFPARVPNTPIFVNPHIFFSDGPADLPVIVIGLDGNDLRELVRNLPVTRPPPS